MQLARLFRTTAGVRKAIFRGIANFASAGPLVVTLRTLDNQASIRLDVDTMVGWSDSRFGSLPLTGSMPLSAGRRQHGDRARR